MIYLFLLLLFGANSSDGRVTSTAAPAQTHPLHIISAIDSNLNVQINVDLKENSPGTSKAFKLYYTNDSSLSEKNYQSWTIQEKPSDSNFTQFIIDGKIFREL
ncbi:unnamed protein product [Caenorhabditis angaria]|uniref:Uncharacterized protein n=1 Tax=Caenorhabditis angaria TaxID=860376 RepID=A0A9P1N283_9PELO|nr:unnamed protein product [Caenorhabditis angaria]